MPFSYVFNKTLLPEYFCIKDKAAGYKWVQMPNFILKPDTGCPVQKLQ